MQTIKFSQNWNNKLLLDNYFTTIRCFSNNNHVKGALVRCEYTRKGQTVSFVCEIASVYTALLDQIPEFVYFIDTGYNKEDSIKMFESMYSKTEIDIHTAKFCILTLRHRPDLEKKVEMQAEATASIHSKAS